MGALPPVGADGRLAVSIPVAPAWADHRFQGRAVLPAVEALNLLAGWVRALEPARPVRHLRNATFDKFLELPPHGGSVAAWCELRPLDDGALRAALLTRTPAASSGMTRTRIHAQAEFLPADDGQPPPAALDLAAALAGPCFTVDPGALYRDLVPFGPGFRTIARPLFVTAEGALAIIDAPPRDDGAADPPLGAPLVLDAALHAACVWSQRHAGIVAFPVGFRRREIVRPAQPGEAYVARIFPVGREGGALSFDIWILDAAGRTCEVLRGVAMRDVSGGTLRPPAWVGSGGEDALEPLARICGALVLVERATLMPFAEECLSDAERQRTPGMSPRRRAAYLSSRLACKRLFRRLAGDDDRTPPTRVHTLAADGVKPAAGSAPAHCSVAHDRRFTVAVGSEAAVGVDVEPLEGRLLENLRLFAGEDEQALVAASPLGGIGAAARVWTLKEAAAKMLGLDLAAAWARARVLEIGPTESRVAVGTGPALTARHVELDGHLITVLRGQVSERPGSAPG